MAYVITVDDLLRTIQFLLDRYYNSRRKMLYFTGIPHNTNHFWLRKKDIRLPPILAYADFSIPFTLYTDASGDSIGFNLTQVQHDKERAIVYGRRNFLDTEKKYSVTEREAFSVIAAIQKCRPYLLGNHFTVVVDHQALKRLMSLCYPTGRLARWAFTLQGYDFTIQYRPGNDHGNADTLSRWMYIISQQPMLPQISTEELRNAQNHDNKLQPLIRYLQEGTLPKDTLTAEKILWQEGQYFLSDNNILYRQPHTAKRAVIQLVVPKTLQTELLHWCHKHFTSGHLGLNKTYERLRSTYFWNNMFADLRRWVKSCVSCAQNKRDVHHLKPPLLPMALSGPWEVIAADCMGPLPATNLRNRYILIIGDVFTKYIETTALPSIETTIITQVFLDKIVFWNGPPHRFLTDRGTNFTLKLMAQLCNDLNINKVFTSSYHPQCDGFVERINGVIMQIIAMYVASDHKDWDMYLASATYAYNTSISKTTGDTPFFLTYGREPVKVPDVALLPPLIRSNSVDYHQERLIRQICTARQLATECTQQAQQCMKLYYDQHAKDQTFWVGHKVWICNYAVKLGLSKKLCCLWHGPFCLIE